MLVEGGDDRICQMIRQDILGANLNYTRPDFMRERQHSAKVQIVREYDVSVG